MSASAAREKGSGDADMPEIRIEIERKVLTLSEDSSCGNDFTKDTDHFAPIAESLADASWTVNRAGGRLRPLRPSPASRV